MQRNFETEKLKFAANMATELELNASVVWETCKSYDWDFNRIRFHLMMVKDMQSLQRIRETIMDYFMTHPNEIIDENVFPSVLGHPAETEAKESVKKALASLLTIDQNIIKVGDGLYKYIPQQLTPEEYDQAMHDAGHVSSYAEYKKRQNELLAEFGGP